MLRGCLAAVPPRSTYQRWLGPLCCHWYDAIIPGRGRGQSTLTTVSTVNFGVKTNLALEECALDPKAEASLLKLKCFCMRPLRKGTWRGLRDYVALASWSKGLHFFTSMRGILPPYTKVAVTCVVPIWWFMERTSWPARLLLGLLGQTFSFLRLAQSISMKSNPSPDKKAISLPTM